MTSDFFDQIPEAALGYLDQGKGAALATVIETWGSAPRPVGAQLAISSTGEMVGSVSGGCVEGAVTLEALDCLNDGTCRILEFGVADDDAFSVGLACGGTIRILVEPLDVGDGPAKDLIKNLMKFRAARKPVACVTHLDTWARRLVTGIGDPLEQQISQGHLGDKSFLDGAEFVTIHNPPLRLIIVGAVHIAQPLCEMARMAGYDVALVDPRENFLTRARFPNGVFLEEWPDEALKNFGLDARTAVVTLAHDAKIDLPAIRTALNSDVMYLGCLGSKLTQAKRRAALEKEGFGAQQLGRIHGPVGADIGAKSPAEIAISIIAELTERLRKPQTRP